MIVEDQTSVVSFLSAHESYGVAGPVEVIGTHISEVFLAGDRAYKLKRAVRLPYVDFSTVALRHHACQEEVVLNRLTAPTLYLGIRRITREDTGELAFDGAGRHVDTVVEMVRFTQESLFDRMALDGRLTPELMTETAQSIARFHHAAPVISSGTGSENVARVLAINEAGFRTSSVFSEDEVQAISKLFRARLHEHTALLDRRAEAGRIRRCHGDLHLRNICMFEGAPHLFDCIEFNPQIAISDVLYDLAFLLMDLWHRGLRRLANLVLNRYLDEVQDDDGFGLLPFLMATRAAVRAHVTATQACEAEKDRAAVLSTEARSYYVLALDLLQTSVASLVAIAGLSGSGKTTVAELLACDIGRAPGARIIESDRIRKSMHGVAAETRLPASAYQPEVSMKVYRELERRAAFILERGGCALVDAVYPRPGDRKAIEDVARHAGVPFLGVWLEADPAVLWDRVRHRLGGPSDADTSVLAQQLERGQDNIGWLHLDASGSTEAVSDAILTAIRE